MPLPDHQIVAWAKSGGIQPFEPRNVNPASIDLRLGNLWRVFDSPDQLITNTKFTLYPRSAYTDAYNTLARLLRQPAHPTAVLAMTLEWICIPDDMAAMVKLKSTPIREGLGYPIADWVDPGYVGHLTLMLTAHRRVYLEYGRRVVQLVLDKLESRCLASYRVTGHYNGQSTPTISWREEQWQKALEP